MTNPRDPEPAREQDPPPPARLRSLLADPATREAALLHLQARLERTPTPTDRAPLLDLLPRDLAGLRPELQLRLADMYLSVGTGPSGHLPDWRAADLLPAVALAWQRLELRLAPTHIDATPTTLAALRSLRADELHAADALLTHLLRAHDPALHREALRLLIDALHAALLAPSRAAALLLEFLADETAPRDPAVDATALRHLNQPWAHGFPCPRRVLLRILHAAIDETLADPTTPSPTLDPIANYTDNTPPTDSTDNTPPDRIAARIAARRDRALAAIELAARHPLDADLRALADDPDIDGTLRRAAFLAAAPRCERDALGDWLTLATTDPPLFGRVLLPTLRALHRRGIFLADAHLPAILELTAIDRSLDPIRLAALCYPARHALIRQLRSVPFADPRWPRWVPLLAALDSDEAPPLLRDLLTADPPPPLRRDLLRHLAVLRDPLAEPLALALLPIEPSAALAALRAFGGPATISTLCRDLGLGDDRDATEIRPYLRADERDALTLLWHLLPEDDPTRERMRSRLDPRACPLPIARDLARRLAPGDLPLLLTSAPEPTAVSALQRLADTGSRLALPLARDLLRRIVSEVVAGTLIDHDGQSERPPATDPRASEAERKIPEPALRALRDLGERLHERDAIRPACLLTRSPTEAGVALLVELLLELAAEAPDPGSTAIALHALTPLAAPQLARHVHRYLRHRDPRVRAAAIVCLARHGVDDLCASLTRLAHGDDLVDARQALHALGEADADAAAPTIAAWLDHPNMNLKKAAAVALRRAGTPEVAPAIVRWLAQHDNPGLRTALSAALIAILGDATTATLIAALDALPPDDPDTARRRRLLILALDRTLSPAAVHAAAHRHAAWLAPLLTALRDHTISLRTGTLADLAPLLPLTPPPSPTVPALRPAIAQLLATGYSETTAAAILADPHDLTPDERTAIRPYLREWLTHLNLHTPNLHTSAALALILQIPHGREHDLTAPEQDRLAASIDALAAHLDEVPRAPLLTLLDVLIPRLPPLAAWHLADRLRSSTPRPNPDVLWLARLRRCGVLLTRADLERALHDTAATPDPADLARKIVRDALALPSLTTDESHRRTDLAAALRAGTLTPQHPGLTPSLRADLYPDLPADLRPAWLDALLDLHPLGLPTPPPATPPRPAPPADERAALPRLLARLTHPRTDERQRAAEALLAWPDPSAGPSLLTAYLAGHIKLSAGLVTVLAATLAEHPDLLRDAGQDPTRLTRLAALLTWIAPEDRSEHTPLLLHWWTHGPDAARQDLTSALRQLGPMRLLPLIEPHLRAGAWGHAALLTGDITSSPAWLALLDQAPPDLAASLRARTVPAPLGPQDQHTRTLAALTDLLHPLPPPPPSPLTDPDTLRERLHDADPEAIRHALTDMSQAPGPDWPELLDQLVDHPSARVRLHAHRLLRASGERERYLAATLRLLDDPQQDIQRMAMRSLAHAGHVPAVLPLVERLVRDRDPLHREVIAALRRLGPLARGALLHARSRARPDRRHHHDELLAAIASDHD